MALISKVAACKICDARCLEHVAVEARRIQLDARFEAEVRVTQQRQHGAELVVEEGDTSVEEQDDEP